MKRRLRLRRRGEFQKAVAGTRLYSGRAMVAVGVASTRPASRVGVTVSRSVKGAVARNRARRRLREASRLELLGPGSPLLRSGIRYDVVLIGRPAALELSFEELLSEASAAAQGIARAAARSDGKPMALLSE